MFTFKSNFFIIFFYVSGWWKMLAVHTEAHISINIHKTDCCLIGLVDLMNMQQAKAAGKAGALLSDNTWRRVTDRGT